MAGDHRDLHVLTHSFPTRRSSDLCGATGASRCRQAFGPPDRQLDGRSMNETIVKFGHPATLIAEYEHWVVLLRPAQPTLGALILAAKSDATEIGRAHV